HAFLARLPRRLDERAPDVAVFDQTYFVRQPRLLRVAGGGRDGRVGHADDHLGVRRVFLGQLAAEVFAHDVDVAPVQVAVGTVEIDVFERAEARRAAKVRRRGVETLVVDGQHFAGFDVAHELGPDGIQGARLRRHDPGRP